MNLNIFPAVALLVCLCACQDEVASAPPQPVVMTADAIGHYCQMIVLEHEGPKAQIHLADKQQPIWFTQVRDAIAFIKLPEETGEVIAIYVNDMAASDNWKNPGEDNWINARDAFYVLGSNKKGGMGAPEAVPFSTAQKAEEFAKQHSGEVVSYNQIPDQYVLAPVDVDLSNSGTHHHQPEINQ